MAWQAFGSRICCIEADSVAKRYRLVVLFMKWILVVFAAAL